MLLLGLVSSTLLSHAQKTSSGDIWLHMLSTGQPAATRYLGDQLNAGNTWYINFEIGQASWNQSDAGIGKSNSSPSEWNWRSATWYANGSGSNKQVRSDFGDFRFTSTGNWYFAGRAKADAGDPWHYANSDIWGNSPTFNPIYYFLVNALNNPGGQTASLNGTNPSSQIDLTWTKDAQNHNVMIVRKKSTESWTEPTQGTSYSVGSTIGNGVVVYNSNGTSYSNTGLNSSTGYDYKFYSENWSYYSAGVTTTTVYTASAPSDFFRSKTSGNWNAPGSWETSQNNTNWVSATLYPTNTANTTTIKSGHTVTVNTSATVNSITIESGAVLSISSGNNLTVSGALANSGTSSAMVVESGGSLITNGSVSGSATMKREIPSDTKWHFISSPVTGQTICDGNFAPTTGNFNATTGPTYDFYKWSEPVVSGNLNWLNLKNSDWTLNTTNFGTNPQFDSKTGYLVAYSPSFAGSSLKAFAGILVSGDQTISLGTSGNTWNLVGNPFASAVDWDLVSKTNLDGGYYYIYNENKAGGAGYESYLDATHKTSGANGKIASTQGFFVKASGSSLILPNSARVHDNNWMKSSLAEPANQLTVRLHNSINYDEAFLIFEEQGTPGRDFFDAFKMRSMQTDIPQIGSIIEDETELSINSLPFSLESFQVQLRTYIPADGEYSLEFSGIQSFPITPGIVLEDLKLNQYHDVTSNLVYSFSSLVSDDPDRFVLHFTGLTSSAGSLPAIPYIVITDKNFIKVITLNPENPHHISVTDMAGRTIYSGQRAFHKTSCIDLSGHQGVFIVSVSGKTGNFVKKVVVQ